MSMKPLSENSAGTNLSVPRDSIGALRVGDFPTLRAPNPAPFLLDRTGFFVVKPPKPSDFSQPTDFTANRIFVPLRGCPSQFVILEIESRFPVAQRLALFQLWETEDRNLFLFNNLPVTY
jgi:hypothetical protein